MAIVRKRVKTKPASIKYMACCGTRELVGVSYRLPFALVKDLVLSGKFAHVFFTDTDIRKPQRECSGWAMEEFINANNLGKVIMSETRVNPNSGNKLTAWIWTVSRNKLKKWQKENPLNA